MESFAPTAAIGHKIETVSARSPFITIRLFHILTRAIDAHGWITFTLVSCFCGWGYLNAIASRPLDHDELFTSYIAQAHTLSQLFRLTHTIDLHPPLSYLLVSVSYTTFGVHEWSCRLPFFLSFLIFTAFMCYLAARLLSPLYGILAAILIWSSSYVHLATEARPYSMVLCFTALLLVGWLEASATDGSNIWALIAIIVGGSCLLLSHVLGTLAYGAILGAEFVRLLLCRKPCWRLWIALALPLLCIFTHIPLIRLQSNVLFTPFSQASPRRLAICYWEHFRYLMTTAGLIFCVSLFSGSAITQLQSSADNTSLENRISLLSALVFLSLIPIEIYLLFSRTGTPFYERYGIAAMIPCVLLPILLLGYRTHANRHAAAMVAAAAFILLVLNSSGKPWLVEQLSSIVPPQSAVKIIYLLAPPPIAPPALQGPAFPPNLENSSNAAHRINHLSELLPYLPLVAGSGPTFLELDHYQDAPIAQRLYLLTNHNAATTIIHNTVFDHYELLKTDFPIRGQVQPYCDFLSGHSKFYVLGGFNYPDTWVLKKLAMDGARFRLIGTYDDSSIEEHQVYEVNAPDAVCLP